MSDLLGIGASALSSYRTALATVGDNVANAETKGYSRREVRLASAAATGGTSPFYRGESTGGVRTAAIVRAGDAFKAADSRLTASDAARADARARWLGIAEQQVPDDDSGLGAKLTAVYTAADALAADPAATLPRTAMLTALDAAASGLRTSAAGLARVSGSIGDEAGLTVATLNDDLAQLDKTNSALRRLAPGTGAHAAALDERDRLLDAISGAVGIDATFDDHGAATVTLAGTSAGTLLDAAGPALVGLARAADGRLSLSASRGAETSAVAPVGGSLAGLADTAASVAGRRRQLDGIASDFAAQINGWNGAGRTPAGTAGAALLDASGGAAALALLTADPSALAAADGSAANGNALALAARRGPEGIEARLGALVSGLAQTVSGAKAEASAASARSAAATVAREEVSGVDLDHEAAELIRFQQAYNGSAKIVQVARETLQSILELF